MICETQRCVTFLRERIFVAVLKSDAANGVFGFGGPCIRNDSSGDPELVLISCPVERSRGDYGVVHVNWEVRPLNHESLKPDFLEMSGLVQFGPGERLKVNHGLTIRF